MEVVDKHVFVGDNDSAVLTFETEAVAVLGGLDAIDEDELAATLFVVDIFDLLLCVERERSQEAKTKN